MRLGFALFADALGLDTEAQSLRSLRETSPIARSTDGEKLQALAKGARYYVAEALWMARDNVPLHPMSRVNWTRWIEWYDRLAQGGIVPEVTDAC